MKNLNETLEKYDYNIINAICNLTNKSSDQVHAMIKQLDADEYINLVAAVDKDDLHLVNTILSKVENTESVKKLKVDQTKKRITQILKNKKMDWDDKKQRLFSLIKNLKNSDWKLIWPTINKKSLRQLYKFATNKSVREVTNTEANELWTWTKDNIMEQVIYQNQIVEVKIEKGPNGTVGILLDSEIKMVPKNEIKLINENVLGMIGMPSLVRIRQLAGMDPIDEIVTEDEEESSDTFKVIKSLDEIDPHNASTVQVYGGEGTETLKSLRQKIQREIKWLMNYVSTSEPEYTHALKISEKLHNSLKTMIDAQEDLKKVEKS